MLSAPVHAQTQSGSKQTASLPETPQSFAGAASKLQQSTVLVRVLPAEEGKNRRVVMFSGVAVADEKKAAALGGDKCAIVTPIFAAPKGRIKVTMPDGDQAQGRIRVLDEYSGLALVLLDKKLEPLEMMSPEEELPVGSWIISAAAMGTEKPLVSLGIVSGTDRTLAGNIYPPPPPLLQCDLRTAETSSGAGLVNADGKLAGVVVGQNLDETAGGWTYGVPVKHVQRLLRAAEAAEARRKAEEEAAADIVTSGDNGSDNSGDDGESSSEADSNSDQADQQVDQPESQPDNQPASQPDSQTEPKDDQQGQGEQQGEGSARRSDPDPRQRFDYGTQDLYAQEQESIVVLKCRRPIVGMVLDGGEDEVYVQRVKENGPAWRAGVRQGDQIVAADDVKIRNVYQAVRPSLFKQPGDTQRYHIERGGEVKVVEVVLDGGVELESTSRQQMWNSLTNNYLDIKEQGENTYQSVAQNQSRSFQVGNQVGNQVGQFGGRGGDTPRVENLGVNQGNGAGPDASAPDAGNEEKPPLELQLDRYRAALQIQATQIKTQQDQIEQLEKEREDMRKTVESLIEDLKQMKQHINMPAR